MFINFLLLQTGVNAYLKSHRKESRWDARFIEFLSFELFGTLGELLFERVKLGIIKSNWTKSRLFCFIRVFQFLQFVPVGVLLISNYEWKG